jgi:hypothetical protein
MKGRVVPYPICQQSNGKFDCGSKEAPCKKLDGCGQCSRHCNCEYIKRKQKDTTEWIATPKKHSTKQGTLVSPDETADSIGTINCFSVLDDDDMPELLDQDCSIALPQ